MNSIRNKVILLAKTILVLMVAISVLGFGAQHVSAMEKVVSGSEGTDWYIDEGGVLTIEGGTLNDWGDHAPWEKEAEKITAVRTTGPVKLTTGNRMFFGCTNLTELDMGDFDTSDVKDMSGMFYECKRLKTLDLNSFDTSNATDMSSMFRFCEMLNDVDVSSFNTANVTDMSYMFDCCRHADSLDVSGFNTSKVTNMKCMFECCTNLNSIDVSKFDTSNVEDMSAMFWACTKITALDLSSFTTSKVSDMQGMFYGCDAITSLDVSGFDTSSVTDMSSMFQGMNSIKALDLRSFDTSKVEKMELMFAFCKQLRYLDISSFNMEAIYNFITEDPNYCEFGASGMFMYLKNLETLKLGKWSTIEYTTVFPVHMRDAESGERYLAEESMPKEDDRVFERYYRKDQPIKIRATKKVLKAKTIKRKSIKIKPITVSKAKGKVTYKVTRTNKNAANALSKGKIKYNSQTGKFIVKKGLKKGTYKMRVEVAAKGDFDYEPGAARATVVIIVK